jgi:hypothetical protein
MNEDEMKAYEGYLLGEVNTMLDKHFNKLTVWEKSLSDNMRVQVNEVITPLIREIAGMQISVRDSIAMSALNGILAAPAATGTIETISEYAYKYADAMMAARKVNQV